MIQYISTRGNDEIKNSAQAIIQGIAKDKGLFVPNKFPGFNKAIASLKGINYQEIAFEVKAVNQAGKAVLKGDVTFVKTNG